MITPHFSAETVRTMLQTAAIIVAVIVFVTREVLESGRRKAAKARRLAAIKAVLARACELNHWTVKSLKRQFAAFPSDEDDDDATEGRGPAAAVREGFNPPDENYSLSFRRSGRVFLVRSEDGKAVGSSPLWEASLTDLKSMLLDVAELDPQLFEALDDTITGLEEVNHVRDSLIGQLVGDDGPVGSKGEGILPGFVGYARNEIDHAHAALRRLYQLCTGKPLADHRVR